ncbi:inner centromere protein [Cordyceps fumosorosea ARSEF 2679]|uniref:Inner centromere protein n=1 Tax=Cordyceps fumosorosea (strain ARSEF 2679) TaxID=1081104 RepID=A0A167UDF4_CORFA|nr:inner centromere protein [Cordyceps fumosorosea ARSEF 2679]OAA61476.1 inner centromere protein [Cordyceps fumosorosea ARSEF 2679]
MAAMRGPRLQVGSAPWIAEERSSALQIVQSEVEEFSFSARNEMEWLNEHMASIFDENETNFADVFKTPGKLRGKTPRAIRKPVTPGDARVPLSDVFTATPNGPPLHHVNKLLSPIAISRSSKLLAAATKSMPPSQSTQDSGYYGSQDIDSAAPVPADIESSSQKPGNIQKLNSPTKLGKPQALFADMSDKTFQSAKEEQTRQFTKQAVFSDAESSPLQYSFAKKVQSSSPLKQSPLRSPILHSDLTDVVDENDDPTSPSESSSPIRQVVRKSSLNFASLPAREPLAGGKNAGRVSRVSHVEKSSAGRSLGNAVEDADVEVNACNVVEKGMEEELIPTTDAKTYTQRLQDQINQLGKSNTNTLGQARSYPAIPSAQQSALPGSQSEPGLAVSPTRKQSISKVLQTTPGAFPEEDDDDWIEPPSAVPPTDTRPAFPKSYTADVMEGIQGKGTIGQPEFSIVKTEQPTRVHGHGKSASVSTLPSMQSDVRGELALTKSTSIPQHLGTVAEYDGPGTPSGSPSRLFRDSPLKQMKSKLSSILKGSRSLLASSAAISAEGKSSLLSSTAQLGAHASPSTASFGPVTRIASDASQNTEGSLSPAKTRRTRASAERQREDKRREKEAKLMAEQLDRLDKAREKEREKAWVFSKEQERIAAMEKEIAAKKQEEQMHTKQTPKARGNARKRNSDDDEQKTASQDVDMVEVPHIAPPSAARTASTTHSLRNRDVKRPVKPIKEDTTTMKQAPTVIRVKPGSQHSQFHQATRQSTIPQETATVSAPQHQPTMKASKASLHNKASSQSLKSSANTRPKAAETAAKKKEAEEREAQKRREAKAEAERKRAASLEEQRRQEQQRRAEAERQKKEKELAEERKTAQRQAALEKAKQMKAPPPAARSQPNGPPDFTISQQQKAESQGSRPPSRMMAGAQRQPAGANLSKSGTKRPVGHETTDDRPPTRAGPSYQGKDTKRRRTSEVLQGDAESSSQPAKSHAVRPSPGFRKDLPPKSLFQNGYSNAPPSATHDLFKASVASHQLQSKGTRPVDMAQISKGNIPFAPNPAGPAFKTPARPGPYLAAKSAAKSVPRSSPQFQNGEAIELPEIETDDEDEDDDPGMNNIAGWAASPDLRAALMRQETMDPSQIFGPPAPLNMEEVFSKSKDRWPKFRNRTSSANWSGPDGLTEDDIRKDLAAREKLRREGGWSYEMSKDVL